MGFPLSRHPLELLGDCPPPSLASRLTPHASRLVHIQARDMARYVGQRVTMLGWLITSKGVETKDGDPMEFVSFEDTTALYDATVFPDAYRRSYHLLSSDRPYLLEGLVEEDFGTVTLTVHHVQCLALTPTVGVEAISAWDAV